jgi:hypothetical protein
LRREVRGANPRASCSHGAETLNEQVPFAKRRFIG